MRAAVYHGAGDVRVEDVAMPIPREGEVLLEVHAAGICGTDASEFLHGPKMFPVFAQDRITGHIGPMIPGHEFGGRVVEIGPGVETFRVGDLVASGAGISCGRCLRCEAGRTSLCVRYSTVGLQRNGALAQYCVVPSAICLDVRAFGLTDDSAALAQPMAIAVHSMRRGRLEAGDEALVIGAGGVGAFLIYAAARAGAKVVACDLDAARLEIADALGAAEVVQAEADTPLAELARSLVGKPAVVYEVSGSPQGLEAGLQLLSAGGRLVAVGLQTGPHQVDLRRLTLSEVELIGTNAHVCAVDLPEAVRLLADRVEGWEDVAPIALPLDDLVEEGLIPMVEGRRSRIKTLLDPWTETARATDT